MMSYQDKLKAAARDWLRDNPTSKKTVTEVTAEIAKNNTGRWPEACDVFNDSNTVWCDDCGHERLSHKATVSRRGIVSTYETKRREILVEILGAELADRTLAAAAGDGVLKLTPDEFVALREALDHPKNRDRRVDLGREVKVVVPLWDEVRIPLHGRAMTPRHEGI